jgi:hypothetical protein
MQQVNYSHRDVKFKLCLTYLNFSFFIYAYSKNLLNSWSDDDGVESDTVIENSLRSLFDSDCLEYCRLKILASLFEMLKCADVQKTMRRDRRAKLENLGNDDLFMPVRGRRTNQAPIEIRAEKKAKLDVLRNDLFVPNRGRRQMVSRKDFLRMDLNPFLVKRNNGIELSVKDYFVPNRGKRQSKIDDIFSDNFFPQRGKKVIIPKSHTPFVKYPLDPWLFQNINSDDRQMIDRQRDLNRLGIEVSTKTKHEKEDLKETFFFVRKRVHKNCTFFSFINVNSLSSE